MKKIHGNAEVSLFIRFLDKIVTRGFSSRGAHCQKHAAVEAFLPDAHVSEQEHPHKYFIFKVCQYLILLDLLPSKLMVIENGSNTDHRGWRVHR